MDPSIQAAMLEASAAETASNELDFLKQNKNRQQRETVCSDEFLKKNILRSSLLSWNFLSYLLRLL